MDTILRIVELLVSCVTHLNRWGVTTFFQEAAAFSCRARECSFIAETNIGSK
jgi:hypothetical protein